MTGVSAEAAIVCLGYFVSLLPLDIEKSNEAEIYHLQSDRGKWKSIYL